MKKLVMGLVVLSMLICGCGKASKAPLNMGGAALQIKDKSLVLFTIDTANSKAKSYVPSVMRMIVTDDTSKKKKAYGIGKVIKGDGVIFTDGSTLPDEVCLMSMDLESGVYQITNIRGSSGVFPIRGNFAYNLPYLFEVKANEKIYIGRIKMVLRTKMDKSEQSSGGVIPLLDQAVTGFGTGTFELEHKSNYDEDMKLFMNKYPFLNGVEIKDESSRVTKK